MKHLFQFLFLAFFAATTLVLSSCGDDKKTDPTPTTGTVNGQITPANAVTTVTATSSATPATTATATPNASGAYTFSNLAAGTYTLSFTPATGYATPATQTVTVTAGGTATASAVTVTTTSTGSGSGAFAYTINGTAITANLVTGNVLFGSLLIQSSSSVGSRGVTLSLDQVPTSPRTYTFGGAGSTSEISVVEAAGAGLAEWNTTVSGGTGTVTITSVSTNPRRASGTFSAVAQPRSGGASGTRTITTGTFSNVGF
ncbi:carboxypeptidase-like regulatory domain-containing protein [Hymenobacter convexus]|uniref:carboxypeptidase-like regulatory domain-containing protein n=1 Tax=Hymenobacter sp. CA1UV-4 TaxID=3063782 RepID=UPI002713486F|nr:carboxypeptidase-like regulatory domain-containing protein [Hymenobacter sp. CA1UV-4]MDO7851985.1 carboxypeptidase-like regulatory domain-containing protein [Hymenobacter sp. CA1UV-4]